MDKREAKTGDDIVQRGDAAAGKLVNYEGSAKLKICKSRFRSARIK